MADDFTRTEDIQLAAGPGEGADCAQAGDDANDCAAGGEAKGQGNAVVAVAQPADGGAVSLAAMAGQVYDLQFDPRQAEVRVIDADGDGDLDMVLVFNAGTAAESRIVFQDMVEVAQSGNPPLLQSGGAQFGADAVVQQAQALAGEQPTLETAAPGEQDPAGTGVTQYDDDLGSSLELLNAQGVIPPVEMSFPSLEPTTDSDAPLDVPTPTVEVRIGAGAEFAPVLMKEDAAGGFDGDDFVGDPDTLVAFSAAASDGLLTTIVVTGFDNAPGWDFDMSLVEAAVLDLGGSFSFDGSTLTIDLSGLGQSDFAGAFAANPAEDSDVDLGTLTIEANAVSDLDPGLSGVAFASAEVQVDAVLDEALELGADGVNGGGESDGAQTFSLNLDSSPVAPFAGSGDGGADTDGSETTVVLLTLDAPLPDGASLSSTAGTVTPTGNPNEYAVTGADLEAAVDGLQVTVPAGFEGTVSGSLSTTSGEANTPEGAAPASGAEPDTSDNLWSDSVDFTVTVTPGEVAPQAAIGLPTGVAAIKEDSSDNTVEFSAQSGDATDELTTVVIELPGVLSGDVGGFDFGADAGKVASVDISDDGTDATVTITLNGGVETLSGSFLLDAPVEDGDADLTGVTITANAQDASDNAQTGSGGETVTIAVDAVLDEAPAVSQATVPEVDESTSGAQTVLLGLDFAFVSAGFDNTLPAPASGGDSGDGGSDADGSESVTSVTVGLSDGTLVLDAGYGGSASLTDNGGGDWTLSGWADAADLEAAVEALSVTVAEGFDGTVTGTVSTTTQEANTPEGAAPASGQEPDTADNVVSDSFDFSLVVDSLPTAGNLDIAVDEDDLPAGNSDVAAGDDLADPSATVIAGTLDFDFAADAAGGSVDFAALDGLAVEDTGGNPVTSGSVALVYDWNAATDTLTALAGATPVFTVVVTDPSAGDFTFTLLETIDHPTADSEDNLAIAMGFTVTDGDGDTANGTLTVDIDDDSPAPFSPAAAEVSNQAGGDSDTADLDADDKVGADQPGTVAFSGGSDGDLLVGSVGGEAVEALTSGGHQIVLTGFGTDTLTGFLDENDNGVLDGGETTEVIRIDLAPGADSYTVTLSQMIDNGESILFNNFGDAPSGQQDWIGLDDPRTGADDQNRDVLFTATDPATDNVNTSTQGIGEQNQAVDPGESIRIDFVTNLTPSVLNDASPGAGGNLVDLNYGPHYTVTSAGFFISQAQNGPTDIRISVYDELVSAATVAEDLTNDEAKVIASVTVLDENGVDVTASLTISGLGTTAVVVEEVDVNYQILVQTADGFQRLEVENVGSNKFDLGGAVIGEQQSGEAVEFSSEVTLTDSDGDSQTATLPISLVPSVLVVGSNEGDGDSQLALHRVANPENALFGAIDGGDGGDLLIGDPGGVTVAGQFNIAIAVDVTGSIGPGNIVTLNAAVESLVQQIIDEGIAEKTVIRLVTFAVRNGQDTSGLEYAKTFTWDGTQFVAADAQTLDAAIDAEVANTSGDTDFDSALQDAADFFNGLNGGTGPAEEDVNRIFFMTDGQDNSGPGGDFDPDNVPDLYGPSGLIAENDLKIEVFGIQSSGGAGSGFDPDQLNLLDDGLPPQPGEALHDGEPSPVDDVEADIAMAGFDELGAALTETLITTLSSVGGDVISGGDRGDIIFGDVPNTDALAASEGLGLSPGSGWFVFEALEAGLGAATPGWERGDTTAYLEDSANWSALTAGGRGEDDTIDGGAGDDVILGQGGDDTLTGGADADTFVFNLGGDDGADTITDFDGGEDALWFADVVDGAGDDLQDVDDMIVSIVDNGAGDVQVNFTSGGSIDFEGIAFVGQTSIADLVDTGQQITVDHA